MRKGILPRWNAECKHSVNQKQQLKRISEKFPEYVLLKCKWLTGHLEMNHFECNAYVEKSLSS